MQKLNTDKVLQWRLIWEEYGPDIKYITDKKNIAADALLRLPNNGNQETTHESNYTTELFGTLWHQRTDIGHVSYIFQTYQGEDPIPTGKLKCAEYKKASFSGGRNTIESVTLLHR